MQALALKHRPKTFDDVVEQKAIKQILEEQIKTGTNKNCYLMTGGAGTGKTTTARIFADALNKGQGAPIEIDGASNNGVENVRKIIDEAKYKSIDSEFKVYIIDECHMLSIGAWNAMLKLIEEPPAKTIFLFATTDPQKIPATIISRVQRYDFSRITHEGVVNRLKHIIMIEVEDVLNNGGPDHAFSADEEALNYIAKLADGGMRDAITLLDKCLSYADVVTMQVVIEALGVADYSEMECLTKSLANRQINEVIEHINSIHRKGADLKQFMKQYQYFVTDVIKYDQSGDFTYLKIPTTMKGNLDQWEDSMYVFAFRRLKDIIALNSSIKWEVAPKSVIESILITWCLEDEG